MSGGEMRQAWVFWCASCDCCWPALSKEGVVLDEAAARAEAWYRGWKLIDGAWYCPIADCAPKEG